MNDPCTDNHDKTGEELKAQRFEMLADIAKELAGEIVFPTYFDAILRLRKVLQDESLPMTSVVKAISLEPLISAKLIQLANSAAYNADATHLVDLNSAVNRLGLNTVRAAAYSVVMNQLMRARGMAPFAEITQQLWEHSLLTAASASVIARETTRLNPDEALLTGMIHDLGAFYMLYRATQYDELRTRPDTVKYLMIQWHESIGVSLLNALGLPEEIVEATADHDHARPTPPVIKNLGDLLYIANMLAGGHFEWLMQDRPSANEQLQEIEAHYGQFRPQIKSLADELRHGSEAQ